MPGCLGEMTAMIGYLRGIDLWLDMLTTMAPIQSDRVFMILY